MGVFTTYEDFYDKLQGAFEEGENAQSEAIRKRCHKGLKLLQKVKNLHAVVGERCVELASLLAKKAKAKPESITTLARLSEKLKESELPKSSEAAELAKMLCEHKKVLDRLFHAWVSVQIQSVIEILTNPSPSAVKKCHELRRTEEKNALRSMLLILFGQVGDVMELIQLLQQIERAERNAIRDADRTLSWLDSVYGILQAQHSALRFADAGVSMTKTLLLGGGAPG